MLNNEVVVQEPDLFDSLNLIDKFAAVLTITQKLPNLQSFATMVGDMLRCIQVDHMSLKPNSFNCPIMELGEIF